MIKSTALFVIAAALPLAAQTCNLPGPPTLSNAVDGAAFRDFGFSANSFITIFGLNFGPVAVRNAVGAADIVGSKFPTVFQCVAVEINGTRAPILYVEASQINAQIPSITALGNVNVVVILNPGTANEKRSNAWPIKIDVAWPSAFRYGITECVAARFQDGTPAADPVFVQSLGITNARIPQVGDIVTIYVNGLGATTPAWQAGDIPNAAANVVTANNVQVMLNGIIMNASDVLYAGLSPSSISGLYQINIRVPATAISGNNPIVVTSANFSSQPSIVLPVK